MSTGEMSGSQTEDVGAVDSGYVRAAGWQPGKQVTNASQQGYSQSVLDRYAGQSAADKSPG